MKERAGISPMRKAFPDKKRDCIIHTIKIENEGISLLALKEVLEKVGVFLSQSKKNEDILIFSNFEIVDGDMPE